MANIPLCVPSSITFKKYHLDHHRYQGDNKLDVDIPSHLEGYLFYNTFTKVRFLPIRSTRLLGLDFENVMDLTQGYFYFIVLFTEICCIKADHPKYFTSHNTISANLGFPATSLLLIPSSLRTSKTSRDSRDRQYYLDYRLELSHL